jgi:hypothetical protein
VIFPIGQFQYAGTSDATTADAAMIAPAPTVTLA